LSVRVSKLVAMIRALVVLVRNINNVTVNYLKRYSDVRNKY
jgi:hypothetical protein